MKESTKIVRGMKSAMEDFKEGRFRVLTSGRNSCKHKYQFAKEGTINIHTRKDSTAHLHPCRCIILFCEHCGNTKLENIGRNKIWQ